MHLLLPSDMWQYKRCEKKKNVKKSHPGLSWEQFGVNVHYCRRHNHRAIGYGPVYASLLLYAIKAVYSKNSFRQKTDGRSRPPWRLPWGLWDAVDLLTCATIVIPNYSPYI